MNVTHTLTVARRLLASQTTRTSLCLPFRALSNNAASSASSSSSSSSDTFSNFIAMMERNQQTSLGTDTSKPFQSQNDKSPKLKCGIPENMLRFRSVSFGRLHLAPYLQPAEFQVALKVYFRDLPLAGDLEEEIFHQIVGKRFNSDKNELLLTSDKFASRIENKRHLCSMLDRIVLSTKRLAQSIKEEQGDQ